MRFLNFSSNNRSPGWARLNSEVVTRCLGRKSFSNGGSPIIIVLGLSTQKNYKCLHSEYAIRAERKTYCFECLRRFAASV